MDLSITVGHTIIRRPLTAPTKRLATGLLLELMTRSRGNMEMLRRGAKAQGTNRMRQAFVDMCCSLLPSCADYPTQVCDVMRSGARINEDAPI